MFSRVLIANRGEIALRILRACKELGMQTVCVYSQEDRDAPYLRLCDRSICIGPGASAESYLKVDIELGGCVLVFGRLRKSYDLQTVGVVADA